MPFGRLSGLRDAVFPGRGPRVSTTASQPRPVRGEPEATAVLRASPVRCALHVPPEVAIKFSPVDVTESREEVLNQDSNHPVARRLVSAASSASDAVSQQFSEVKSAPLFAH